MSQIQWMDDALCRQIDQDLFFPEHGGKPEPAIKICKKCNVQNECLTYALTFSTVFGVWGGTTEAQRRLIKQGAAYCQA